MRSAMLLVAAMAVQAQAQSICQLDNVMFGPQGDVTFQNGYGPQARATKVYAFGVDTLGFDVPMLATIKHVADRNTTDAVMWDLLRTNEQPSMTAIQDYVGGNGILVMDYMHGIAYKLHNLTNADVEEPFHPIMGGTTIYFHCGQASNALLGSTLMTRFNAGSVFAGAPPTVSYGNITRDFSSKWDDMYLRDSEHNTSTSWASLSAGKDYLVIDLIHCWCPSCYSVYNGPNNYYDSNTANVPQITKYMQEQNVKFRLVSIFGKWPYAGNYLSFTQDTNGDCKLFDGSGITGTTGKVDMYRNAMTNLAPNVDVTYVDALGAMSDVQSHPEPLAPFGLTMVQSHFIIVDVATKQIVSRTGIPLPDAGMGSANKANILPMIYALVQKPFKGITVAWDTITKPFEWRTGMAIFQASVPIPDVAIECSKLKRDYKASQCCPLSR